MRPTDENQNGSTRPNFMSASRRAYAGDDNILARLERDAKRGKSGKSGQPWKHARLAWCMAASVLVIALIGTLASLARDTITVTRHGALADARPAPSDTFGNDVRAGFAPLPVPSVSRKFGASVYDAAPEPALLPPMVMLKSAVPAAAKSAAAAAPLALRPAAPKVAKTPSARIAALSKPAAARAPAPAPTRSVAAASPSRPAAALSRAPSPARPLAVAPRPRPVVAAAPARSRKPASAAPAVAPEAGAGAVDGDVALLSAIIMHASRHSAERAQMEAARCGGAKKCVQNDPIPSLKITD